MFNYGCGCRMMHISVMIAGGSRGKRAKEKKKTYEITMIRMRNLSRKATDSWSLY